MLERMKNKPNPPTPPKKPAKPPLPPNPTVTAETKPTTPKPNKTGAIPKTKIVTKSGKKKKKKSDDETVVGTLDLKEYFQSRVENNTEKPDMKSPSSDSSFLFLTAPLEPKAEDKKIGRSDNQTKSNGYQESTAKGEILMLQNDL